MYVLLGRLEAGAGWSDSTWNFTILADGTINAEAEEIIHGRGHDEPNPTGPARRRSMLEQEPQFTFQQELAAWLDYHASSIRPPPDPFGEDCRINPLADLYLGIDDLPADDVSPA